MQVLTEGLEILKRLRFIQLLLIKSVFLWKFMHNKSYAKYVLCINREKLFLLEGVDVRIKFQTSFIYSQ